MLIDEKGDQILIRRNHHYKLNIKGALSFGQENFAAALTAAAHEQRLDLHFRRGERGRGSELHSHG